MASVTQVKNWRGSGTDIVYPQKFPDDPDMIHVEDTPPTEKEVYNLSVGFS